MKKCPKCGCEEFIVSAHVVQTWVVDKNGNFERVSEDCTDVTHAPDNDDMWTCAECGHYDSGNAFEIESEEKEND